MRLLRLELKNFQGVGHFVLEPNGEDINVYGDNGTGKTTLVSAFNFLLFGKNHDFKTDFEIKTLEGTGEATHGLEHTVEATLELEGRPLTLTRTYREKWQKKRGAAEAQFTGHETIFHIDGVPAKKSEYETKIKEIAEETIFRLLTSPDYFNAHLHWDRRREILLSVCGDIRDQDVIASDKALKKLPGVLGDRTIEDHRKIITARRKAINEELEKLPVRIDEVSQGQPDVTSSRAEIEQNLATVRAEIQEKHQEKARIVGGGEIAKKRRQLAEAQTRLIEIDAEAHKVAIDGAAEKRQAIADISDRINNLNREALQRRLSLEANQERTKHLEEQLAFLREQWAETDAESFTEALEDTCPACGQDLPAERVEAAREKALADFNRDKARRLETNIEEGKQKKAEVDRLASQNQEITLEMAEIESQRDKLAEEKASLPEPGGETDITYPPEHDLVAAAIKSLESDIDRLAESDSGVLTALDAEIEGMKEQIIAGEAERAKIDQYEKGKERINELIAQEKKLAAEYERLEEELYLMEEFTRVKVRKLESKINSRFELARFKLFNELINGGIEETCETTYQGVPYSDLNGAAKINVGLDIIRTLSKHYDFLAPVWIDNAESVVELLPLDSQVIRLVVSGADKELRVETQTKPREAECQTK